MKKVIIIVVLLVFLVGGISIFANKAYFTKNSAKNNNVSPPSNNVVVQNAVTISNFAFSPSSLTVAAGSKISFVNNDNVTHTVTFDNGALDKTLDAGQMLSFTIAKPGTYTYHCKIHPSMKGEVIIR